MKRTLTLLIQLSLFGTSSYVAAAQVENQEHELFKKVVVTATKNEANLIDTPRAISIMNSEQIRELQAFDALEVLDWLPGVSVSSDNRYLNQISIRGLSRGRVVVNVDGVNHTINSNKGMEVSPIDIDPYLLESVEVQRGSSSVLYGSGGLGGVVALKTKSVDSLLEPGQQTGGFIRQQFGSLYDTHQTTLGVFGQTKDGLLDGLLTATHYEDELNQNSGEAVESRNQKFTAKVGVNLQQAERIELKLSKNDQKYVNESVVNPDKSDRQLLQLKYNVKRGNHLNLQSSLSHKSIDRNANMLFAGQQDTNLDNLQFDIQNSHKLGIQELSYGLNTYRIEQSGTIDGVKDSYIAPEGERSETAVYIQDKITLDNVVLLGALRYNKYTLESSDVPDTNTTEWLPSLGATWHTNNWLSLHANYSHDFRAPSIDDMYTSSVNFFPGIDIVANPDLKPESSKQYELGFTLMGENLFTSDDHGQMRFSYYDQDIQDMISLSVLGVNPNNGNVQYGSVNVDNVDRRGAELEAEYMTGNLNLGLSADISREKFEGAEHVASEPRSMKLRASYYLPASQVKLTWLGKITDGYQKNASTYYGGYMVNDLRVAWENPFNLQGAELNFAINNLLDRDYKNKFGTEGSERNYRLSLGYKF